MLNKAKCKQCKKPWHWGEREDRAWDKQNQVTCPVWYAWKLLPTMHGTPGTGVGPGSYIVECRAATPDKPVPEWCVYADADPWEQPPPKTRLLKGGRTDWVGRKEPRDVTVGLRLSKDVCQRCIGCNHANGWAPHDDGYWKDGFVWCPDGVKRATGKPTKMAEYAKWIVSADSCPYFTEHVVATEQESER